MPSKDEIVATAIRHLNEDPTASMEQIAEAAGIGRATLHRHFAGRDALILELGRHALDSWQRCLHVADVDSAATSGDPAQIRRTLGLLMKELARDAEEYGFALTEHVITRLPELVERAEALEEREMAFYRAAQAAGVLRAGVPVRWISNMVNGLLIAVRDGLRRGDVARRDVPDLLCDAFLNGTGVHE